MFRDQLVNLPTLCLPDLMARVSFWGKLSETLAIFPMLKPKSTKGPVNISFKKKGANATHRNDANAPIAYFK